MGDHFRPTIHQPRRRPKRRAARLQSKKIGPKSRGCAASSRRTLSIFQSLSRRVSGGGPKTHPEGVITQLDGYVWRGSYGMAMHGHRHLVSLRLSDFGPCLSSTAVDERETLVITGSCRFLPQVAPQTSHNMMWVKNLPTSSCCGFTLDGMIATRLHTQTASTRFRSELKGAGHSGGIGVGRKSTGFGRCRGSWATVAERWSGGPQGSELIGFRREGRGTRCR